MNSVWSPPPKPGSRITGRPSPRGTSSPRNTRSKSSRDSSSAQRLSRRWSPHQRSSGSGGSSSAESWSGSESGRTVRMPSVGETYVPGAFARALWAELPSALGAPLELARALGQPCVPVRPPAARELRRLREERLGRPGKLVDHLVAGAAVCTWRIDERLDVTAVPRARTGGGRRTAALLGYAPPQGTMWS